MYSKCLIILFTEAIHKNGRTCSHLFSAAREKKVFFGMYMCTITCNMSPVQCQDTLKWRTYTVVFSGLPTEQNILAIKSTHNLGMFKTMFPYSAASNAMVVAVAKPIAKVETKNACFNTYIYVWRNRSAAATCCAEVWRQDFVRKKIAAQSGRGLSFSKYSKTPYNQLYSLLLLFFFYFRQIPVFSELHIVKQEFLKHGCVSFWPIDPQEPAAWLFMGTLTLNFAASLYGNIA